MSWQERDEAFGANAVERLPDQHQRLFDLRPIASAERCRRRQDLLAMVEQPPGIFACVPCGLTNSSRICCFWDPDAW